SRVIARAQRQSLNGANEMAARERGSDDFTWAWAFRRGDTGLRIECGPIRGDDMRDGITGDVEDEMVSANAGGPERGDELRPFDGTGMKQPVSARRVRRDGKGVAGGIRQAHVRMLLHAQVAAGGRLAIKGCRQHAVLDRHAL